MIVLDTNVVSELLRSRPDDRVLAFVRENTDELAITTITIHEVMFSLARVPEGRRRRALTAAFVEFTESLTDPQVLDLTESAARRSGVVRALRATEGRPITPSDAHIAGIALTGGHALATRNTKDFDAIGLDLIDPWI